MNYRVECLKTGEHHVLPSRALAYRKAQLLGMVDHEAIPTDEPVTETRPTPRKRQRIMRAVGTPVSGMEIAG